MIRCSFITDDSGNRMEVGMGACGMRWRIDLEIQVRKLLLWSSKEMMLAA